jgi:hypothetical protein
MTLMVGFAALAADPPSAPATAPAGHEVKEDAEAPVADSPPADAPAGHDEQPAAPATPETPRPAIIAPLAEHSILLGIAAAGKRLVAVGQRGDILLSENGRDWTQVQVPVNAMLNRVRFRDDKVGFAVGHDGAIVMTRDGGDTWTLQNWNPEMRALYDILFLDEQRIVVIGGYGTYLLSGDNGTTWEPQSFPITELGQHLNAAARLGDGSILIAGEKGLLARSKDNGATWELLDTPYTGSFFGLLPVGPRGAIVYGLRGNIYASDDVAACPKVDPASYDPYARETVSDATKLAKLGWTPLERPTREGLFGGTADGTNALLVGVNGVIVHVDTAQKRAALLGKAGADTLNDVARLGDRWIAVGRRGAQDLGTLGD